MMQQVQNASPESACCVMSVFRTILESYLLELSLLFFVSSLYFLPFPKFPTASFKISNGNRPNNVLKDDDSLGPDYSFEALLVKGDTFYPDCQIQNVVFDLGDVLFRWSASSPESPICSKTLNRILHSAVWFDYERGNISEHEAYARVADQFNISSNDVARAFQVARDSLRSDPKMLEIIRKLKASGKAIFAMSNISAPDWEVLKTKANPSDWALFDMIFIS